MSIKPDRWIRHMATQEGMIDPFEPRQVRGPVISYGLSSYGYDIRLADEFRFLCASPATDPTPATPGLAQDYAADATPDTARHQAPDRVSSPGLSSPQVLDPKFMPPDAFEERRCESYDLAPGSFVLGRTVEYFRIPLDVLTLCVGKSTYARCGVLVNVTPFEPGWEGHATLCIANIGACPVRLHAGEGIAQVLFFQSDEPCEVTYADKRGKYQAQRVITPARLG